MHESSEILLALGLCFLLRFYLFVVFIHNGPLHELGLPFIGPWTWTHPAHLTGPSGFIFILFNIYLLCLKAIIISAMSAMLLACSPIMISQKLNIAPIFYADFLARWPSTCNKISLFYSSCGVTFLFLLLM